MATLAELKPYIDLGMTAQIIRLDLLKGSDLEKATLYVFKRLAPEDEQGFTGLYRFYYYTREHPRRFGFGIDREWLSLKRSIDTFIDADLSITPTWTLDPTRQWES